MITLENLKHNINADDWTTYLLQQMPELLPSASFIRWFLERHELEVYVKCIEEKGVRLVEVPADTFVEVISDNSTYVYVNPEKDTGTVYRHGDK